MLHEMQCSEIWGGHRGDELDIRTSAVRGSLFCRACDGGKGGDVYYFSVCGSDLLTRIALADVMGHGAAVSDVGQWLYDSLVVHMNSADGSQVLSDLNGLSVEHGYRSMSTAVVATFYRANRRLYFSYAGHHEVLFNRKGTTEWTRLAPEHTGELVGVPLGVDSDARFRQDDVLLEGGDRLFLYTDGVIEARSTDDQLFGEDRLVGSLKATAGEDLGEVRTGVLKSLLAHTSGTLTHDDVTFMAIEILETT